MKKILLFFVLIFSCSSLLFSAGMPVIDFTQIANTIMSISNDIDRWKQQLRQWEEEYKRASKAAEAIASGDYMTVVDGILEMSNVLMDYRTSPYSLDDSWLASVEQNVNSIGLTGYKLGIPIERLLRDNVVLTHSTAKIKQTITNSVKKYNKAAAGQKINCSVCGGTGRIKGMCEKCGGTGYNPITSSWKSTQKYEFGEFLERCFSCGGTGHVWRTCNNCKGSGKVNAPETYRKITVDGLINLLGSSANFLEDIAGLAEDLGDLQITASEYKGILEHVRDDYLHKYDCNSFNDLTTKITNNKKQIIQEQKEQEAALKRNQGIQAQQHELTAKKLQDNTNELLLLNSQLLKLQTQIEKLDEKAKLEEKYELYRQIQEGVERTNQIVQDELDELTARRQPDIPRIPASAFF